MNQLNRILGGIVLAACSSSTQLPANYAPAQTAIGAADAVGAKSEPRAALHLKMARDAVVRAQALSKEGEEAQAELMLERARTDAELALMVTREATARREATAAQREVEGLPRSN
jgi:hypothetical protein